MQSVSTVDFVFLFMHATLLSLSLSDLSEDSFNERMSLPALWEGLRKLPIFCEILVFSMPLKHLTFGILFCFVFFFRGEF